MRANFKIVQLIKDVLFLTIKMFKSVQFGVEIIILIFVRRRRIGFQKFDVLELLVE